jgi:hypothetical protein
MIVMVNPGVLRWTWWIGYYGWQALGTDTYRPSILGRQSCRGGYGVRSLRVALPTCLGAEDARFDAWVLNAARASRGRRRWGKRSDAAGVG